MPPGDSAKLTSDPPSPPEAFSLWRVRAAQLRARAAKAAIVQVLLGSIFLVGALAYARAPDRQVNTNIAWMAGLLVFSTFDVALGLRTLVRLRLRRRFWKVWVVGTAAWGGLSTALLAALLRAG
jgi:hypothetical protein